MKKMIILLMIMMLLPTSLQSASATGSIDNGQLDITVLGTEPFPAQPGKEVEITLRVTNVGNKKVDEGLIRFYEEYPFSPIKSTYELGEIAPGVSATKKVKAIIAKDSQSGKVDLPIRTSADGGITWVDSDAQIEIRESTATLAVTNAETKPSSIAPGHEGILEVRLRNDGSNTLTALEIMLDDGDAPIIPIRGSNIRYVGSLKPDQSTVIEFPIAAESDAKSGNYAPRIVVNYNDFSGNTTKTFDIGIKIFEEPSFLMNIESREVYTGKDLGNIVLSLANTGTSILKFTTIKLLPGEDYEVVDAESNYLGDLDPDDFQTAEFKIKLDTKKDYVDMNAEVTFKDAFNNEKKAVVPVKLRVFGEKEAVILGLKSGPNIAGFVFNLMIGSLLIIFWVLMLVDLMKNKSLSKDRKWTWTAILILSNVLGAVLYYFMVKKKQQSVAE